MKYFKLHWSERLIENHFPIFAIRFIIIILFFSNTKSMKTGLELFQESRRKTTWKFLTFPCVFLSIKSILDFSSCVKKIKACSAPFVDQSQKEFSSRPKLSQVTIFSYGRDALAKFKFHRFKRIIKFFISAEKTEQSPFLKSFKYPGTPTS